MLASLLILYGCGQAISTPEEANQNVAPKEPKKVVVNEGLSKEEEADLSQRLEELEEKVEAEERADSPEQQQAEEKPPDEGRTEADLEKAVEDYYLAVDREDWGYTYDNLDSQTRALFDEEEWYLKNQYFADTEGLELATMDVQVAGYASNPLVGVTVYRTFTDGTSIDRDTAFVWEDSDWKHRFVGEELEIYAPEASYEEFVAQQLGATSVATASATASASASASAPSEDMDCADFATQQEAQAVYEEDSSDPHGFDADGDGEACEELPGDGQYEALEPAPIMDPDPDPDRNRAVRSGPRNSPASGGGDIDCDQVDGPIPTPASDPDNLDADGDGWACE